MGLFERERGIPGRGDQSLPAVDHLLQADRDMQRALVAERSLMFVKLDAPDADEQVKVHADSVTKVAERWKAYIGHPGR